MMPIAHCKENREIFACGIRNPSNIYFFNIYFGRNPTNDWIPESKVH